MMKNIALFSLVLAGLGAPLMRADPLTDDAFARVVARGAKVETLAQGFRFVKGPAWNPRGFWVFSDIPAKRSGGVGDNRATKELR